MQPPPPLKKSSQNQGGLTGVQPPHPKFRGGLRPPNPPPPLFGAPAPVDGDMMWYCILHNDISLSILMTYHCPHDISLSS